jgi:phosphate-selective porin
LRTGGNATTTSTVSATDLYVALSKGRWSGTIGQFKTPFSREFLTASTVLELPDRAMMVDALAPNRDVGAMVEWKPQGGEVRLVGGGFNGRGINRVANNGNRLLYVGRIIVKPAAGFELAGQGASYADSSQWDVDGEIRRGPWTGRAEYLRRDRTISGDHADGWYALGAYTIARYHGQLVGRVEQFVPAAATGLSKTGYTGGAQYFVRGDDLKVLASYTAFSGQALPTQRNSLVVQMQLRF